MPPAALLVLSTLGIASAAVLLARKRAFNRRWQAWLAAHPDFLFPVEAAGSLATKLGLGNATVIYQMGTEGASEFTAVARTLADRGYSAIPVSTRTRRSARALPGLDEVLEALPTGISRLVLAGHGAQDYYFTQWSDGSQSINPTQLASALSGKLAPGAVVALAGCNAGANPGDSVTVPPSPNGGERGFAGRLRDMLVASTTGIGGEVRAHSTRGHTTWNPNVRVFEIVRARVGAPGVAVDVEQGQAAERYLLGLSGFGDDGATPQPGPNPWLVLGAGALIGALAAWHDNQKSR